MWTSLRIYIYKIVDFISGLSGLLYRTGWTSVNGILKHQLIYKKLLQKTKDQKTVFVLKRYHKIYFDMTSMSSKH